MNMKISEEHLQSSIECMKTQNKNDKKKVTIIQSICQNKAEEGHAIERNGIPPAASHLIPPWIATISHLHPKV